MSATLTIQLSCDYCDATVSLPTSIPADGERRSLGLEVDSSTEGYRGACERTTGWRSWMGQDRVYDACGRCAPEHAW